MSDALLERLRRIVAPRYEVDREIGSGGMGLVYAGRDVPLDRPVAIKVLRPELASAVGVERFLREPRLLARLSHPNIVHVYDTSDAASELSYYVMEFLEGRTLEVRLRDGAIGAREAAAMGRHVLAGLQFAHDRGIIHRDVKPSNIFLLPGRAVLTDFGVAKSRSDSPLTGQDQVPGTRAYSPPEARGNRPASPQGDIYSLAMVVYEAATGGAWDSAMRGEEVDDAGLPHWFAAALRRALERSPDDRWPDAASFGRALRAPRQGTGVWRWTAVAAVVVASAIGIRYWTPAPTVVDLAVFPFDVEGSLDRSVGRNLSRTAALLVELFPRVGLVDPLMSFGCWDARAADDDRETDCGFRARRQAQGRVAGTSGSLDVTLVILDERSRVVATPVVRGSADSLQALADRVAIELVRAVNPGLDMLYRETRRFPTVSLAALNAFLDGEEAFQLDDWSSAELHYRLALERDPEFALATWRLAVVQIWRRVPLEVDLGDLYERRRENLPPLVQALVRAQLAPAGPPRFAAYDSALRLRPDAWAALLYGNELHGRGALSGVGWDSAVRVLGRAVALDPSFAPALTHVAWEQIRLGDDTGARRTLDALRRAAPASPAKELDFAKLLELAYAGRFGGSAAPPAAATPKDLEDLARSVRFGLTFDVPETQRRLGALLTVDGDAADSVRATGHEAQGTALVALGRVREALAHFDSAATLYRSGAAELEAAEWRVLLGPMGPGGVDSAEVARGLGVLASRVSDGRVGARAAWALAVAADARGDTAAAGRLSARLRAQDAGDTGALRLAWFLDALEAAARGEPETALRISQPLLAFDSAGRGGDPFLRGLLHLRRGAWLLQLDRTAEAAREWLWWENADLGGWPTGSAQAGDVDWALGTYARLLLGRLGPAAGRAGMVCTGVRRAVELWAGADASLAALRREAQALAAACKP